MGQVAENRHEAEEQARYATQFATDTRRNQKFALEEEMAVAAKKKRQQQQLRLALQKQIADKFDIEDVTDPTKMTEMEARMNAANIRAILRDDEMAAIVADRMVKLERAKTTNSPKKTKPKGPAKIRKDF